jgi:hypothetical protein
MYVHDYCDSCSTVLTTAYMFAVCDCCIRDNSVLCYSVDSACLLSRLQSSHDDSVSCMALCQNYEQQLQQARSSTAHNAAATTATTSRLITGAFDATVKVLCHNRS